MSYKIEVTSYFKKQAKHLLKKYPSLKHELAQLITLLELKPEQGTRIGKHCFKIRISISSKGKGKSGGARVITNFAVTNSTVYLLSIYDKAEKENLTDKELNELLQYLP
jgi:mRNA-degrading endonuclease RelE of RelBE toxin-antitoxin system